MPLHIDIAAAIRRPTDQAALVQAVLAADWTDETHWLEWKSRLDLTAAEGRFTVAKAILGLANRHPDYSARAMQGCGYLVVGVEPANLVGLPPVDAADLDAQLRRFLGQEGPQWSPTWIPVDGTHVLLITVEPPRWATPSTFCTRTTVPFTPGRCSPVGAPARVPPAPPRWRTYRTESGGVPISSGSSSLCPGLLAYSRSICAWTNWRRG
jgi:hypothetical protein